MQNEQISKYQSEIDTLEKQIASFPNELKDINQLISKKYSDVLQIKDDCEKTETDLRAIGFFKFKERKPLKEKLKNIKLNIETNEIEISELKDKVTAITEKEKVLKGKLQTVRQAKDILQKELELKEKASQGDLQAQFEVAKLCFSKKEKDEAMDWLKKAAGQGHSDAKKLMLQIEEDNKKILSASYDITLW